ncbi:unnamed protein product [Durusdinium trenchii]|uniref:Uncharacterized protein n=1 Tax=Durusdinium trenchii TaxID=1381693 RepID=A0ABP0RXD1_9DINO
MVSPHTHAKALACKAAKAATSGGTAQGAFAMKELAKLAESFQHEELQVTVAEMTLQGLQTCELHAKTCVKSLVDAISPENTQLAQDAAWALSQLMQKVASATRWALEVGGLQRVQGCLRSASQGEDLDSFAWLVHYMGGLSSILELLKDPAGSSNVASLVWMIADQRSWVDQHGEEAPEVSELLKLLVQHLLFAWQRQNEEVVHATVTVLEKIATELPSVASQLAGENCGSLFAEIMKELAADSSTRCRSTSAKCCRLLSSLASCRCNAPSLLGKGVQEAILTAAQHEGPLGEAACGALPFILEHQGLAEVLQSLAEAEVHLSSAPRLRHFLGSLVSLFDDGHDSLLEAMPKLMSLLLHLRSQLQQAGRLQQCQENCFEALCSAAGALVPLVEPQKVEPLDAFINVLVQELQGVDLPGGASMGFEMLVNELGKVCHSRAWRQHLRDLGVPNLVIARMNQARDNKRAMKYSIWLASSLLGMPFLAQELQQHLDSETTVDACLCTMVDILDEDVEGEWFLRHQHAEMQQQLQACDLQHLMDLILQGMERHQDEPYVQARGCHCLALVVTARDQMKTTRLDLPQELLLRLVVITVEALRKGQVASAVRDSAFLLRTMLEPSNPWGEGEAAAKLREEHARQLLAQELRARGVQEVLLAQLHSYAYMTTDRHTELLEGLLACLIHLGGPWAALGPLAAVEAREPLAKACGLKVLFEMGKEEPSLLQRTVAPNGATGPESLVAIINEFLEKDPEDSNLRRHAQLLFGLCEWVAVRKSIDA